MSEIFERCYYRLVCDRYCAAKDRHLAQDCPPRDPGCKCGAAKCVPQPAPEPVTERAGDDEPPFYGVYPGVVKAPELVDLSDLHSARLREMLMRSFAGRAKLRRERDELKIEIERLRAELAELKRLAVAAGLARIASGEAEAE